MANKKYGQFRAVREQEPGPSRESQCGVRGERGADVEVPRASATRPAAVTAMPPLTLCRALFAAFYPSGLVSTFTTHELDIDVIFIFDKLRHRNVNELIQSHTAHVIAVEPASLFVSMWESLIVKKKKKQGN